MNKFPVLTPPLISVLVVLVVNSFISLGDHEISHGEISHGHQENLLVNKFPFFTPFIDGVLQRGHFQHFKHTVDRWPTN